MLTSDFKYASSHHATIFKDGNTLMFKDTSSNGTVINGENIVRTTVPIKQGDQILLAGKYALSWTTIRRFFPDYQTAQDDQPSAYQQAMTLMNNPEQAESLSQAYEAPEEVNPHATVVTYGEPRTLPDFNWGAFLLYPLWGFWNGCWWAIFLIFLPIIFNIIFGIYGNRWSWQKKNWLDAEHFERAQRRWKLAGIIIFTVIIVLTAILYPHLK